MHERPLPPGIQLLLFFSIMILMGWIGDLVFAAVLAMFTKPEVQEIDWTQPGIVLARWSVGQIFSFILALVVFLRVTRQKFEDVINIQKGWKIKWLGITLGVFVGGMAVMELLAYANAPLGNLLPGNYLIELERENDILQHKLLVHDNYVQFIFSLVVIGIIPAIAEELIFRGLLIKKLMESSEGKVHFSIIISSVIFAGIHLQPLKLLPMIFLGMCLGYVYHYTRNIKYSILLHCLINVSQIIFFFYWGELPLEEAL